MALVLRRMMKGKEYNADFGWQRDKNGGPRGGDSTDEEEVEVEDDALTDEERRFLKQFPSWKKNENKRIRKLYAIADSIDKSHQEATMTKVITNSVSAVSGVMSLLGLVLAPVTSGGSLVLTAAGTSLGVAAGLTSIANKVREKNHNKRALAEASRVMFTGNQELENVRGKKTAYVTATGEIVHKCESAWETINNYIQALQSTKTRSHVTSAAEKLMSAGQVSAQSSRQMQKAFGGTALAMTKKALMKNGLLAAISLAYNIYSLLEDWKELEARTPTELAEELRERAQALERVVSERTRRYKRLKKVRAGFWKGPGGINWHLWRHVEHPWLRATLCVCVWCVYVCACVRVCMLCWQVYRAVSHRMVYRSPGGMF